MWQDELQPEEQIQPTRQLPLGGQINNTSWKTLNTLKAGVARIKAYTW